MMSATRSNSLRPRAPPWGEKAKSAAVKPRASNKATAKASPKTNVSVVLVFFFSSRRRHTRCGRDWSSDVCSSDLLHPQRAYPLQPAGRPIPVGGFQPARRDLFPQHRLAQGADAKLRERLQVGLALQVAAALELAEPLAAHPVDRALHSAPQLQRPVAAFAWRRGPVHGRPYAPGASCGMATACADARPGTRSSFASTYWAAFSAAPTHWSML